MGRPAKIFIAGLGASGLAAGRLLRAEGAAVWAGDERDTPAARAAGEQLAALGGEIALGISSPPEVNFDLAVISPGLPMGSPLIRALEARQIPRVSELELGWSRFRGRTLAVTGSNGKSCAVKALAECLNAAGREAIPCGNYGLPVSQAVMETPAADWLVIEVSSFQLETVTHFHPQIAVLLNLLPNHLDRHGTFESYARIKARIFARQQSGDLALTPPEWQAPCRQWSGGTGRWQTFGTTGPADVIYQAARLADSVRGTTADIRGSYFDNEVLGANAAAIFAAAQAAGVAADTIAGVLRNFQPLPHRAERIAEIGQVVFVNDSKATNAAALAASLRMQNRPVWLIAGGRAKETDFSGVIPILRERVRGAFLIGEAADMLAAAWATAIPCRVCGTLQTAVAAARQSARPGEIVLLAPACTSFDQFASFAERGDAFRRIVQENS